MTIGKFRWKVGHIILGILIISMVIIFRVYDKYPTLYDQFSVSIFSGFIGLYFALTLNNVVDSVRKNNRRDRLLRDIYNELKANSTLLVGRGHPLNNDVWESGKSAGLIQDLTPYQLRELSSIYSYFNHAMREAKYCRHVGEEHTMIPWDEKPRKAAAFERFQKLSEEVRTRESKIRKTVDAFLNEDFWEKAGVTENEV